MPAYNDPKERTILDAVLSDLHFGHSETESQYFRGVIATLSKFLEKQCGMKDGKPDYQIADDENAPTTCRLLAEVLVVLRKIPDDLHEEVDWFRRWVEPRAALHHVMKGGH